MTSAIKSLQASLNATSISSQKREIQAIILPCNIKTGECSQAKPAATPGAGLETPMAIPWQLFGARGAF